MNVLGVAAAVAALALASQVTLPMTPVPMTLQTLAVTLCGALLGWRLGALAVLSWLAVGAAGLPVFAEGGAGIARLTGPGAGYLFAFPFAAALTGWLAARGWNGDRPRLAFAAMLLAHALCLLSGGAWLGASAGSWAAFAGGVLPYIPGAIVKSAIGAAALWALHRATRQIVTP